MGKIIKNGIEYGGSTNEAVNINYDNSVSGLSASSVQDAIDEIVNIESITLTITPATGVTMHNYTCIWYSGLHLACLLLRFSTSSNISNGGEILSISGLKTPRLSVNVPCIPAGNPSNSGCATLGSNGKLTASGTLTASDWYGWYAMYPTNE